MKRRPDVTPILLLLLAIGLASCAHYPVNQPLADYRPEQGYRFPETAVGNNTNSLFVCLAFSGGGTRAAALSYGVLEKLRDTQIRWKGQAKSLLDEVDCISSVSGGSFTAAYFALYGEKVFSDFRPQLLDRNVQGELTARAFNPLSWPRLASPNFSRIDLAAELYDEILFEGKTFGDLTRIGRRPFVILNATDLARGERFEFTQDQFDLLGSDITTYPVARAVAASSAFPFLLSPITVRNYPTPPGFETPKDLELAQQDYDLNRRRYEWARERLTFLEKDRRPYVHLMDGGLADNIGLRALESAYRRSSGFINRLINEGQIEKLVFIVVNARTEDQDGLSREETPPGLAAVAFKTATIAMDNFSFETVEAARDLRGERLRAQKDMEACQKMLDRCPNPPKLPRFASEIDPVVAEVDFEAIPDRNRRDFFLSLPTSFALTGGEVQSVIDVGKELLDRSPDFRGLVDSLQQPTHP